MGITFLKKGIWVFLAFSIALNIGFITTVFTQKTQKSDELPPRCSGQEFEMTVLAEMDLPDELRAEVSIYIRQMIAAHMELGKKIQGEEEKMLDLLGQPGPLEKSALEDQIRKMHGIIRADMVKRSRYIIAIRDQLGPEKTVILFSKTLDRFRKRMMRGEL